MILNTIRRVISILFISILISTIINLLPSEFENRVYAANLSDGRGDYATGSNTASSPWGPKEAFDGSMGSYCAIGSIGGYVQMDLGANYWIDGFDIYPRTDNERPEYLHVQGSTDNVTYYTILSNLYVYN